MLAIFSVAALALSLIVALCVKLTIASFKLGIGFGVTQRIANVAVLVWTFAVALHLRSVAQGALTHYPSRWVELPAAIIQRRALGRA